MLSFPRLSATLLTILIIEPLIIALPFSLGANDEFFQEWDEPKNAIVRGPWQENAIRFAYQCMDRSIDPSNSVGRFTDLLKPPGQYERIYITIYVDSQLRGCQSSNRANMQECIQEAVSRTLEDRRFGEGLTADEIQRALI